LARWREEGLPEGVDPAEYFDFDFDNLFMDASLRLPERLLEETDDYTVREDKHGFVAKQWKERGGALHYYRHAVTSRDDWACLKSRLAVDTGGMSRIHHVSYFEPFVEYPTWEEMASYCRDLRRRQRFVLLHVYGPYEAAWRRHGFEHSLMDMVQDQDLMRDMAELHVDLVIGTLDRAREHGIQPDGLFMVEDMGMNTGPLFSPRAYDRVLFQAHRRLGDYLHSRGIAYFIHTDGDVRVLIPRLIDAGIQVLQPMETQHLDVRELKREYGQYLAFMGNIDVRAMSGSPEELEEEVRSKVVVARQGGGYIYHSDHSVPPTVSFENYRLLMEVLKIVGTYTA
jgi:uroporphyrinogen decarboxylase